MSTLESCDEYRQLEQAIATLEAQRAILGDAVVDAAIGSMREKLSVLTPVQPTSPDLHGERRTITAMFADVKGSTSLAEQIDVEGWVEIMNHVLQLLSAEIHRYGGEVDRYEGDGLVAFFGAKAAHEDDPERAVLASLAMQEVVQSYAAQLETERGIELLLRVGLSTGEVVTAHVEDARQHGEETAMGRAIAVAARMEPAAEPGTVLVSEDTYRLVAPLFEWQPRGHIAAKGIREPVAAYRPLAHIVAAGKGRGIPGLSSPLVGRDEELAALRKAVDDLQRGIGGIATVVGEAGIGKSRLVTELRKRIEDGQVQWVEGRCLSYGGSIAYLPWLDMLRSVLSVTPDASPLTVRDALRARLQALCLDCFDAVYPYLCRLMSLPLGEEYETIRDLQGESLRAEVFWAVQTLVEGAARQQPLVIVCEDLHWADATSLALLERVLALTDRAALLLICVFRPEVEHPCWQLKEMAARLYRHRYTDLWLDTLSVDESRVLVGYLLRIEDLPAELRTKILDHAEGNPFYVEEILRALIDDGAIVFDQDSGRWRATREVADIPIPDTLHGVLTARIDRLQEETRRVLRLASVIGRVFSYRVLAEIAHEEAQLDTRLLTLQRQQLIREQARLPELEYIFKHELTREAAYNGLLKRERTADHRQVAEALERLFPEQVDEQAALLAHHWERAEEPDKASDYLLRAGEQARLAYASQEAAVCFRRALVVMDQLPPNECLQRLRMAALRGLAEAYLHTGKLIEAEALLREAITLGEKTGLIPRELVWLHFWLARSLFWQSRLDESVRLAEAGQALLDDERESVEAALLNQHLAVCKGNKDDWDGWRELMYRNAAFVRDLPFTDELSPVYSDIAATYAMDRKVDEALKWLRIQENLATQQSNLMALYGTKHRLGEVLRQRGDLQGAISQFRQSLEWATKTGCDDMKRRDLLGMATANLVQGNLQQAQIYAQDALGQPEEGRLFTSWVNVTLGQIHIALGDWGEAQDALEHATCVYREISRHSSEAFCLSLSTQAYLAEKKREEAIGQAQSAVAAATMSGYSATLALALSGLEEAFADPQVFRHYCHRFRQDHPEILSSPLCQWHLESVNVEMRPYEEAQNLFPQSLDWMWVDPFGDCSHTAEDGLEIRAANGRDMWHINWSAPRLLCQVSEAFVVQTLCVPAMYDRPTIGGLLLWRNEKNYLRLDRGVFGESEIAFMGCLDNEDVAIGRGWLREASERILLRLECLGDRVNAYCSADGERWFTVGHVTFPVKDPVQVGMHAIGNIDRTIYHGAYPEGTAIRFESFQLWKVSGCTDGTSIA
jgi:predicted ATPase/class 3 adenylate cyclase/regulation of enolase protein 1 (concanavalin A-like superfamily)